ncbi:MAG: ROK family protein [Spirochaetia bacterium]|nr:ROK family protein [Spirochaetia bacterium]
MKRVSTTIDVKIANAVKIYTQLRSCDGLSKSQLAHQVQLSFASVSNMCTALEERQLVSVVENVRSTGGRKAARVSFCPDAAYTLSVDIHHTQHIYMGLVNLKNEIHRQIRFEVSSDDTLEIILEHIRSGYLQLCAKQPISLLGICVGISAVHDPNTGMLLQSSNPVFERVPLRKYLSEMFPDTCILVDNDANLAGMSQMMRTDMAGKNLLFIFFTQGIGLGVMIDGRLYRGSNGFAGELGHLKVTGVEKSCKCGGRGCLRTIATLESIAQDLGEFEILQKMEKSSDYALDLSLRYGAGDRAVIERVDLSALKIGEVMADLFDLFNPEEIVLGGNMSELFKHTDHIIRRQCRALSNLATEVDLQIRCIDSPTYELVMAGGAEKMFQYWLEHSFPEIEGRPSQI